MTVTHAIIIVSHHPSLVAYYMHLILALPFLHPSTGFWLHTHKCERVLHPAFNHTQVLVVSSLGCTKTLLAKSTVHMATVWCRYEDLGHLKNSVCI